MGGDVLKASCSKLSSHI